MDWIKWKDIAQENIKKYRYVIIVLLAGILLMALPEMHSSEPDKIEPSQTKYTETVVTLEKSLEEILCKMEGAGKVRVLLTEASGKQTFYQSDEDMASYLDSNDIQRKTVILTDSDRTQSGLIQRIDPPVYQGAVVVCQGADRASVRLSIVDAVAKATGLTTAHITVLKMK